MSQPETDVGTQTLADVFEVRGDWWLPRSPNRKVAGTLKFDPARGARLELMGSLAGQHTLEFGVYHVILGEALDGTPITLTGCDMSSLPPHVLQMGRLACDYEPTAVFRGSHFASIDNIVLDSLKVSYDCLPAWMQLEAVREETGPGDTRQTLFLQESTESHVLDDATLVFRVSPEVRREPCTYSVRARASVEFAPTKPTHYSNLMRNFVYPMQNLLSLAMDAEAKPLAVEGTVAGAPSADRPVRVTYSDFFQSRLRPRPLEELSPVIFSLASLGADTTRYLRSWFSKADLLRPVCDLFFGVAHHPLMYTSQRFLSYCQAFETYHRRQRSGAYMAKEDFSQVLCTICASIPAALPRNLDNNIRSRLRHSCEFSLKDRLRQELEVLWPLVGIGFRSDTGLRRVSVESFVDLVTRTRNGLTHEGRFPDSIKNEHVWHASRLLKMLIECILLTEVGFSVEQLPGLVKPANRYLHSLDALAKGE